MGILYIFSAILLLSCNRLGASWVIVYQDLRETGSSFMPSNWKDNYNNPFSRITSDCQTTFVKLLRNEEIRKQFTINHVQFLKIRIEMNLYFLNMVNSYVIITINNGGFYVDLDVTIHATQSTLCSSVAHQHLFKGEFSFTFTKPVDKIYEIRISYTQYINTASAYLGIRDLIISTDSLSSTNGCPMEYPVLGVNGQCQQYCVGSCYDLNPGYCSGCCPCPIDSQPLACKITQGMFYSFECNTYCDSYDNQLRGSYLDQCISSISSSVLRTSLQWNSYIQLNLDINFKVNDNFEKYTQFNQLNANVMNPFLFVGATIFDRITIDSGYLIQLQGSIYIIGTWEAGSYVDITLYCNSNAEEISLFKIESDGTQITTSNLVDIQDISLTLADQSLITAKFAQIHVQGYICDGNNSIRLYQNLFGATASFALSKFYAIRAKKVDGICSLKVLDTHCISCYSPFFAYLGGCVSQCPTHSIVSTSNRNCTDYKDSETIFMFSFLTVNGFGTYLLKAFNDLTFDDTTISTIFPTSPCITDNCLNSKRYSLLPSMKMFGGYNSWGKGSYSKSWSGLQTHYQIRIYFKLYFIDSWTNSDSFTVSIDGTQYAQESILGLTGSQIAGTNELDYMKNIFYRVPHSTSTLSIEFLCKDPTTGSAQVASCGITDLYILIDYQCHYSCNTCIGSGATQCSSCESNKHRVDGGSRITGTATSTSCPCDFGYEDTGATLCTLLVCHYSCATCSLSNSTNGCLTCPPTGNNRTTGTSTSCPCESGYEDTGAMLCTLISCHHSCATCSVTNSANDCLTCPPTGNNRTIGTSTSCPCDSGYEDTGAMLCTLISCHHSCATCTVTNSANNCLTCPPTGNNRTRGASTSCPCNSGYEDTGATLCTLISCHHSCATCSMTNSANDCLTCPPTGNHRATGTATSCPCDSGYEDTGAMLCTLISCHHSCATCTVTNSANNCLTCPPTGNNRTIGAATSCPCNSGYEDTGATLCTLISCHHSCATCSVTNSANDCLTCPPTGNHRTTGISTSCPCESGYEDTGATLCTFIIVCHYSCATCSLANSTNGCLTCPPTGNNRTIGASTSCPCNSGYEDTGATLCTLISCHHSCATCSVTNSANDCLTCPPTGNHRATGTATSCPCDSGYEDTGATICTLISCHHSCATCSVTNSANDCLTCPPTGNHRATGTATSCPCDSGYEDTGAILCTLPIVCHYSCATCSLANSANDCLTCPPTGNHRATGTATSCPCDSGYEDTGAMLCTLISCHHSCATCSVTNSANDCLTCPPTGNNRTTGTASSCPCDSGYEDTGAMLCTLISCHHSCATCSVTNSANDCLTCPPTGNHRATGTATSCPCDSGYEDTGAMLCTLISCHHSCATCSVANSANDCLTCPPTGNHRATGTATSCPCDSGYEDSGAMLCTLISCHHSCATCSVTNSATDCLTCPPTGNKRATGTATSCPCDSGYEDSGAMLCTLISCHYSCATCSVTNSATDCLTCPPTGNHRTTGTATSCPCDSGYEDSGAMLCTLISCHHSCATCSVTNSATDCLTCPPTGNNRATGTATSCPCDSGYEDSGAMLCTLISCHYSCATCSVTNSANDCLTCPPTGNHRATGTATSCPCDSGYEDTGAILCTLPIVCHYSCATCSLANSANDCLTCPPTGNNRATGTATSCLCDSGYEDAGSVTCDPNSPCDVSCLLCSVINSSTDCVTCPPTSNRVLSSHTCQCDTGYQEDSPIQQNCIPICHYSCLTCSLPNSSTSCDTCSDNVTSHRTKTGNICLCDADYNDDGSNQNCTFVCDPTCLTCTAPGSSSCSSCNDSLNRTNGGNNDCICKEGYQDNSGSCGQITPCHVSCLLCSIASSQNSCVSCDPAHHRTLDNTQQCLCDIGYEDNPDPLIGTCSLIQCHYSCQTCSSSNSSTSCLTCPDPATSYRLPMAANICSCQSNYTDIPGQVNCSPICHFTCLTCSLPQSDHNCQTCPDQGTNHRILGTNNDCPCESGYLSITDQVICQIQCHYSCLTCYLPNSSSSCLTCPNLSTSHREINDLNECPCVNGYKADNNEVICISDCHFSCDTCSQSNSISSCLSCPIQSISHRVAGTGNTCICEQNYFEIEGEINCHPICHETCQTCFLPQISNSCLSCDEANSHRILNQNNECVCDANYLQMVDQSICSPICHQNCSTCLGIYEDQCLTCFDETHRSLMDTKCICEDGYYEIIGQSNCQIQCISLCQTCESHTECLTCKPIHNVVFLNSQCFCQSQYYESNGECLACISPCDRCSSESTCLSCVNSLNRQLINGLCQCQQYYWDVDGQLECISCDLQNGWLNTKCTKTDCNDGVYTYGENCDDDNSDPRDGCLNCQVQKGFFCSNEPLQKSVCTKCTPNCEDCQQDGLCKACQLGYEIDPSGICVSCPDNCESCNNQKCEKCIITPNITFTNQGKDCPICENQPGAYSNALNANECRAICGDLITLEGFEECDDGNTLDSDGCSSICKIEKGFLCLGSQCVPSEPPYPILTSVTSADNYTDFRKYYLNYSMFILNDGKMANRISIQIQNKTKGVDYKLNITEKILEQDSKEYCNYSQIIELTLLQSFETKSLEVKFTDLSSIVGINGLVQEVSSPQQPIHDYYYLSQSLIKATKDVTTVNEITLYILLGMVGLAVLIGGIDTFWNLLDLIQVLSYINFIDTRYPYNLKTFLEVFKFGQLKFLNNIIHMDTIVSLDIDSNEWDSYQPKGIFSNQVESSLFLINASSTITAFLIVTGIYILFNFIQALLNKIYPYLLNKYSQNFSISSKVYKIRNLIFKYTRKYCNSFFWSIIIRTHMSTAYDISFAIFLQLQLGFGDMKSAFPQISYISSGGVLVAQGIIIYFYISKLNIIKAQYKQLSFQKKYGEALFENLKVDKIGSIQTYYNVFLVAKRFIYIAILITVSTVPQLQTLCMSILGSIHVAFIISKRPLNSAAEFAKQLQSEILTVLIHLKICLLTVDDCIKIFSEDGRTLIGWLCVGEISLIMAIQLIIDISQQMIYLNSRFKGIRNLIDYIRNKCSKKKIDNI